MRLRLKMTLAVALLLLFGLAGKGLHAQQAQPSSPRTLSYQGVIANSAETKPPEISY